MPVGNEKGGFTARAFNPRSSEPFQLLQTLGLLGPLVVEPADQGQQREHLGGVRITTHPSGVRDPGTYPGRTLAV